MAKRSPEAPKTKPATITSSLGGEIVIYEDSSRQVRVDVRLDRENVWLNLNQMEVLFDRDKSVISRHLRKIFQEGELDPKATVAFFATVQREGEREILSIVEELDEFLGNSSSLTDSRIKHREAM